MITKEQLNIHSLKKLKQEISKTNIKGYSKLKKIDLIALMMTKPERFNHLGTHSMPDGTQMTGATHDSKSKPTKKIIKKKAKESPPPKASPPPKPKLTKEEVKKKVKKVIKKRAESPQPKPKESPQPKPKESPENSKVKDKIERILFVMKKELEEANKEFPKKVKIYKEKSKKEKEKLKDLSVKELKTILRELFNTVQTSNLGLRNGIGEEIPTKANKESYILRIIDNNIMKSKEMNKTQHYRSIISYYTGDIKKLERGVIPSPLGLGSRDGERLMKL